MPNLLLENYATTMKILFIPKTYTQDIQASLSNSHITIWIGTFQAFLNHWESQWLLVDKSTPIIIQESPAAHKSMLCNAIHSNPDFTLEHLDKLGQAQHTSEITYDIILCYYAPVVVSFVFFRFSDLIASHFADILWPMRVVRFLITDYLPNLPKLNQI